MTNTGERLKVRFFLYFSNAQTLTADANAINSWIGVEHNPLIWAHGSKVGNIYNFTIVGET